MQTNNQCVLFSHFVVLALGLSMYMVKVARWMFLCCIIGMCGLTLLGVSIRVPVYAESPMLPTGFDLRTNIDTTPALITLQTVTHTINTHSDVYTITTDSTVSPHNLSIRLENVGNTAVVNPKVVVNGYPDWSTIDSILAEIIDPAMSTAEKARAIWQFARTSRYHYWPPSRNFTFESRDPVRFFSVYGYGLCDDLSQVMAALFERAGMPARIWSVGGWYHTVVEAYYDGQWHLFDADRDGLYLKRDNQTVAGVTDIIDDPYLINRAGASHADLAQFYAITSKTEHVRPAEDFEVGHEISMTLRPRESLTLLWQAVGPYHDEAGWGQPAPPEYANGWIVSRFLPDDPGYRRWIVQETGLRASVDDGLWPMLRPAEVNKPGELVYRIDSPYPIVGITLTSNLYRESLTDTIDIYVGREVGVIEVPSLMNGEYRVPGVFVAESNLSSFSLDGFLPPLHTLVPKEPGSLVYRVTPRQISGERVQIGGRFMRWNTSDVTRLYISADSINWQLVWDADDSQVWFFDQMVDITERVDGLDDFFVKYELQSNSFEYINVGWTAGLSELRITGVEPAAPVWMSADAPLGEFTSTLDLSSIVVPTLSTAAYSYYVRFVMNSPQSPLDVGLNGFTLTTMVQVAPRSLPALKHGDNEVRYSDLSSEPGQIQVTHSWMEVDGLHAPTPPSTGSVVMTTDSATLAWERANDPDGDDIQQYHLMLCDRADCRWPLSSVFDVDIGRTSVPFWTVSYGDWLNVGQTYYWRVKAQDTGGLWSEWSQIWSFVLTDPLPTFTPTATPPPTDAPEVASIDVQADMSQLVLGSDTASLITSRVLDIHGTPIANQNVVFATSLGQLREVVLTDADGVARSLLYAGDQLGQAQVTVHAGSVWAEVVVEIVLGDVATYAPSIGSFFEHVDDDSDSRVTINIPANAVILPATFTLVPAVTLQTEWPADLGEALDTLRFTGIAFALNGFINQLNVARMPFSLPINISIKYDDLYMANLDEEQLTLQILDDLDGRWIDATTTCGTPAPTLRVPSENRIDVAVCRVGRFGLFAHDSTNYSLWLPLIQTE